MEVADHALEGVIQKPELVGSFSLKSTLGTFPRDVSYIAIIRSNAKGK